jgi:hypothetical protein
MSAEQEPSNTERNATGQFLAGHIGSGGRKRGARNKLGEAFVQALADDFSEHGIDTIKQVRMREPAVYIKVIKDILPREVVLDTFSVSASVSLSLAEAKEVLAAYRLVKNSPKVIEHEGGALNTEAWKHLNDD